MLAIRTDLPYKSFEELRKSKQQIVIGATGPGASTYDFPLLLKEFLGLNIKLVSGYQSSADIMLAARERGLKEVVSLVQKEGRAFNADPRGGPWASVIKRDPAFARQYQDQEVAAYARQVEAMRDNLMGRDESHATSAARYLDCWRF